jgi:hypothetical protein
VFFLPLKKSLEGVGWKSQLAQLLLALGSCALNFNATTAQDRVGLRSLGWLMIYLFQASLIEQGALMLLMSTTFIAIIFI